MATETDIERVFRGFRPSGRGEVDIAALATLQDGIVDDEQLLALGFSRDAIQRRVDLARLHRLYRGVYAVGHRALSLRGRWRAAVLACGPGALLSHRDAGALRGVLPSARPTIEVTVPSDRARAVTGVRAYVATGLMAQDRSECEGIACVSVPLMLLNIAAVERPRRLERACDECELHGLFDLSGIDELLERSRGRRGAARLRSLLAEHAIGTTLTRSELEELMLSVCRAASLAQPLVNQRVLGGSGRWYEVDFLWPEQRLIVETDGNAFHATRRAIERDRRKEADLVCGRYRVLRATWSQLEHTPGDVVLMLRAELAPRRPDRDGPRPRISR
jgi:very-short-patch-repair endonuclease